MKSRILKIAIGLVALAGLGIARSPQDCASTLAALDQRFEAQRHLLADWAGLIRYGSENTELPKPKANETRVVFLGDEITEAWGQGKTPFFPGKPYLNRGIRGQTTPQMLVRFRQDVINLKPKVVVVQAGANDIASFYEPITQAMTAENIMSIVELARANDIRVVLASLTPINDFAVKQSLVRPFGKIIGVNGWLKEYAARSGAVFLDYYSSLAEGRNLKKEFSEDGFLPNDAAYAVMAPLAEKAIAQALGKQ